MDVSEYRKIAGNIDTIFFEPTAFNSVHAQNRARLMPKLYEKISEFEYLLLYELDAFVFRVSVRFSGGVSGEGKE